MKLDYKTLESIVTAPRAISFRVFCVALGLTIFDYFYPDIFIGLPDWLISTVYAVVVASGTLWLLSILSDVLTGSSNFWKYVTGPFRRWLLRRRLRGLDLHEVFVVSISLARANRVVEIKEDSRTCMSLLEKGVIASSGLWGFTNGYNGFEIPMCVWRQLQNMEEFALEDPAGLERAYAYSSDVGCHEREFLRLLPAEHRSVLRRQKVLSAE